jgi:hypothetical protein
MLRVSGPLQTTRAWRPVVVRLRVGVAGVNLAVRRCRAPEIFDVHPGDPLGEPRIAHGASPYASSGTAARSTPVPNQRTTSSLELLVALDRRAPLPLRRQLEEQLRLAITRYGHEPLADRVWALRENLTAYDAAFVALPEALDAVLVTCDARLARAPGVTAEVYSHE